MDISAPCQNVPLLKCLNTNVSCRNVHGAKISSCPLLTAEDFWFFWDLFLQFIAPINLWNKCIDLRLFLKCKEGQFLRSKDDRCWILKLRPWNFVTISESLAANLEKVCLYYKRFQSSDLFDFDMFLFALLTIVSLWGTIPNSIQIQNPHSISISNSPLFSK